MLDMFFTANYIELNMTKFSILYFAKSTLKQLPVIVC